MSRGKVCLLKVKAHMLSGQAKMLNFQLPIVTFSRDLSLYVCEVTIKMAHKLLYVLTSEKMI